MKVPTTPVLGRPRILLSAVVVLAIGLFAAAPAAAAPGDDDPLFGSGGSVATSFGTANNSGQAVAIQADGKIVVAGFGNDGFNDYPVVARYNANGSPDTSFDGDGVRKESAALGHWQAVAVQPDGKIVAAGWITNAGNDDFAVARYNTNGSLDGTFNGGVIRTDPILGDTDQANAVAIQADGKIVLAGWAYNGADTDFAVARYTTAGLPDTSFDSDGKRTDGIGIGDFGRAIAIQPDGKIVVAGTANNPSDGDFAMVRYLTGGALDTSFDGDGKRVDAIGGGSEDDAYAVALQPDGKIVVAGNAHADFAVLRYLPSGSLDTSFDLDGRRTDDILGESDVAYGVALQPDGKIVAGGSAYNGTDFDLALVRYSAAGTPDGTFDGDGKRTDPLSDNDQAYGLALQPDGRIVLAGSSLRRSVVARYLGSYPEASITNASTTEGNAGTKNLTFTVSLDTPPGGSPFSVQFHTADGTALQPDDYTFKSGKLSFSVAQMTKQVSVPIVGDVLREPNERFTVNLTSPLNGVLFDGTGVGQIINDDSTSVVSSPTAGPPTSSVSVSGSGFAPGEWVDLYFDSQNYRVVVADANGAFSGATLTIPAAALPGAHWLSAKGATSSYAAQKLFTVRTDWPQFHAAGTRQGLNSFENLLSTANAGDLDILWQSKGAGTSSPVVAGGLTYAVGSDALLRALTNTGALAWGPFAASASASPAVGGGRAYAVASGKLSSYDAATGGSHVTSSGPTVSNSSSPAYGAPNVYVGGTGALYALNASTLAVVWTGNTSGAAVNTAPAVSGPRVFATASNGSLLTFPVSCAAVPCPPLSTVAVAATSSPVVVGGVVYVGSSDFKLHAFSASCLATTSAGCELWQSAPTGGAISSTPAVANGRVFVGSADKKVYAYPASCSTPCAPVWSTATGGAVTSSPAVANGVVYVGSADKFLYGLQSGTGGVVLAYPLGGAVASSPAVSDGSVYVNSSDNKLNAFALPAPPPAPARPDLARLVPNPTLMP